MTTPRDRIADTLRSLPSGNGFAVFDAETGEGGQWYSDNSHPPLRDDEIAIRVPWDDEDVRAVIDQAYEERGR